MLYNQEKYQKTTTKRKVILVEPLFETRVKIATKCDPPRNENLVTFSPSW